MIAHLLLACTRRLSHSLFMSTPCCPLPLWVVPHFGSLPWPKQPPPPPISRHRDTGGGDSEIKLQCPPC